MRSMDSILADEPTVHDMPESEDSASTFVDNGSEREGTKEPQSTAPETGADESDDTSDPDPVDLTAAGLRKALSAARRDKREERKRSREYQRQLDQLSGHVSALRQPQAHVPQQQPAKRPEDDDEAFYAKGPAWTREVADARVRQAEEKFAAFEHRARIEKIEDAEEAIVERHEDGRKRIDSFAQRMAANPALRAEFVAVCEGRHQQYRNPAKFAYEYDRAAEQANEIGDPESYKAKLRAEWEAEQTGRGGRSEPSRAPTKTPKSIASARGIGVAARREWSGPRDLKDILR